MKHLFSDLKSFSAKCRRVWHSLKKPSKKEYQTIAKVSAIGMLLLGSIGFLISVIMNLFH